MQEKLTNAKRFIGAYNQIDYALRVQYNLKRSMSFSDVIRKAVLVNHIVRKYEDDLIDYGRLRNAIIHKSNEDFVIAEPHMQVVEHIEKIAKLVSTPPNALQTICTESVLTAESLVSIKKVIEIMTVNSYSNIPIYEEGALIGVANGQKILERIGQKIASGVDMDDYLKNTPISAVLSTKDTFRNYEVVSASATIEDVLELYYKNRKLLAVLITKNGSTLEPPLGIITTTNVMEMNDILDNY